MSVTDHQSPVSFQRLVDVAIPTGYLIHFFDELLHKMYNTRTQDKYVYMCERNKLTWCLGSVAKI